MGSSLPPTIGLVSQHMFIIHKAGSLVVIEHLLKERGASSAGNQDIAEIDEVVILFIQVPNEA